MFDCRWCEASNFIDELERDDHESTCWIKALDEADMRADAEQRMREESYDMMFGLGSYVQAYGEQK